ncbi:MAG: ABC transporter permease [Gemmatimonadota bacterium]|nr:ABC transporter permease [Gemmatimonadota bacterium]
MKFARLVLANLGRSKRRTILTALSVTVAFFLFASLRSILTTLDANAEVGSEARLIASSATGITFPLPQAHINRIQAVEGVKSVSWSNWFGGVYIDQRNFFAQFAIDSDSYLAMYPELLIPEDQRRAYLGERTAALVGAGLMERFGWRLGQTVTLQGTIFPGDWEFTIRGVYTPENPSFGDESFYFHYDYLFERTNRQVTPGWFTIQLDAPDQAAAIGSRLDALFENSSAPTKTETERSFQAGFVTMWGNVSLLVRAIGTAVFFAILFVAANTMMMAARERVGEVAVLKTLGFQNGTLFGIVMTEAIIICVVGGVIGIGLAVMSMSSFRAIQSFLPGFSVTPGTVWLGIGIAVVLGAITGIVPALQASRLSVVEALRRV